MKSRPMRTSHRRGTPVAERRPARGRCAVDVPDRDTCGALVEAVAGTARLSAGTAVAAASTAATATARIRPPGPCRRNGRHPPGTRHPGKPHASDSSSQFVLLDRRYVVVKEDCGPEVTRRIGQPPYLRRSLPQIRGRWLCVRRISCPTGVATGVEPVRAGVADPALRGADPARCREFGPLFRVRCYPCAHLR